MELLSDIVTWGEEFLDHWAQGIYCCSRCQSPLYRSEDKWKVACIYSHLLLLDKIHSSHYLQGPCMWPSFRKPFSPTALSTSVVSSYNGYTSEVREVFCGSCELFVGHQFEDGRQKGDQHPEAHWRH